MPGFVIAKPKTFHKLCRLLLRMFTLSRRNRIGCLLVCIAFSFATVFSAFSRESERTHGATAYTIIDNETGTVLESFNGHKKRQIASLTKIATAKIALDWAKSRNVDLSGWVVVPPAAMRVGGVNPVGLYPGDAVSLRDLIYCALLQSDNIAAYTLAAHIGQTIRTSDLNVVDSFVAQMNALARRLGMERTLFLNPTGMEPSEGKLPYSTSDDLARLTKYAMADKGFQFYVSQKERKITIVRNLQQMQYLLRNTNELLGVEGIDGVKTGRTANAGDCLIISASQAPASRQINGRFYVTPRRVSVVILGANDRFFAGRHLMGRAWQLERSWAAGRIKTQR